MAFLGKIKDKILGSDAYLNDEFSEEYLEIDTGKGIGKKAKIVGISHRGKSPLMSIQSTEIHDGQFMLQDFKEFTLNELKEELNSVN